MNADNPATPEDIVAALPSGCTTIVCGSWQQCLHELNNKLQPLGYNEVSFNRLRLGKNHPLYNKHKDFRADRERGKGNAGVHTKNLYCTKCSTLKKGQNEPLPNVLHFVVVGTCQLTKIHAEEGSDDKETWKLELKQLYPHYQQCIRQTTITSMGRVDTWRKIEVDLNFLTSGIFDTLISVLEKTKLSDLSNSNKHVAKIIQSGLDEDKVPNDRRYLIPLLPVEDDEYGNQVRAHHKINNDKFEKDLQMLLIRISLIIANTLGIQNEMFFATPSHSDDTATPSHPDETVTDDTVTVTPHIKHLHISQPTMLVGGYMHNKTKPIHNQMCHTDFGINKDGQSVLENPKLIDKCLPFSVLLPLALEGRSIYVFDPVHELTMPNEITIKMGEMLIIPANLVHAGKTYKRTNNGIIQPLRPAFHFYMESTLHDFNLDNFVPSIGHALSDDSYNDHLKKMPGRFVKEQVAYRINEVVAMIGKVNVNDVLNNYDQDEANKDVFDFIAEKFQSSGKKKRGRR